MRNLLIHRTQAFRITVLFLGALVCVLGPIGWSQTESPFEGSPTFRASDILSPGILSGSTYKIRQDVGMTGMHYSFQVWSRYGWFHPQSLSMLRIRLAEIHALETLNQMRQDPLFLEGVEDQVSGTIKSTASAIRNPLSTLKNIPLGLAKAGGQISAKVQEGNVAGTPEGRFIHEKARRELALSLGVDPYTDNPLLQEALRDVAANKNRGALATRVGTAFIPAVGMAIGAAQLNKGLQDRLLQMSAAELQQLDRETLLGLGCSKAQVGLFLDNPGHTPTTRTAIADAMKNLGTVIGIHNYIDICQEVPSPEVALFYQRRVQMAERFHREVRPLVKMRAVGRTPVFFDSDGKAVVAIDVDYVYWSPDLSERAQMVKTKLGTTPCDLYLTGYASQISKERLGALGITVHEGVFAN